ncbi:putative mesoderm development candidate 2 [Senna tora]|uniref:Putative mesoderm development candidate 2 n=1 Tax=Senna tora TaxID=362788 RepID=A0A834WQR1_9FABA|nr:putative mesoderm development candidate 2 [Senna tora]
MKTITTSILTSLFLLLLISHNPRFVRFADAAKRRVHITDDLDDVIDDEEDDAWREWGKKSTPSSHFDLPPQDLSKMDMSQIQAEMAKHQSGPVVGFVKLNFGVRRTPEMVGNIAKKWTEIMRTGAIGARFMGVDLNTVMFNMERGKDVEELKEFILNEPEAYEMKIGDQVFRRPGDPPLDEVIEKLRSEENKADNVSPQETNSQLKEEL